MKYKIEWALKPLNGIGTARKGSAEVELDEDEIDLLPQDVDKDHALRPILEICGPVPVIIQCRERGGERLNIPTLEYLTKGARLRRRANLSKTS